MAEPLFARLAAARMGHTNHLHRSTMVVQPRIKNRSRVNCFSFLIKSKYRVPDIGYLVLGPVHMIHRIYSTRIYLML